MRQSLPVVVLLGAALLVLAACGGGPATVSAVPTAPPTTEPSNADVAPPPMTFSTQFHEGGRVSVAVTPLDLSGTAETFSFQISMDTHSVDLGYDLSQLATLRTDQGAAVQAIRWDGPVGGHHVNGTLYFPAVNLEEAQWVQVVIRQVAGVPERVFHWNLP